MKNWIIAIGIVTGIWAVFGGLVYLVSSFPNAFVAVVLGGGTVALVVIARSLLDEGAR